ncbi:serine/threonine-protein kinase, partial [Allorhizocola rhizosphaerae]|uniref:serine/threonine-protein kinase n=1 Tax=Allorhizocola rhizosphaerae TaxID=1872709 RepID=UPI0013C2DFDB
MADDGLRPGDLIAGRYRLIDRIGSGGMAVIWRAQDETLDRLVAIKVLDLSLSSDDRMRDLVRREAWAAARLNHPDVAGVHDFVQAGGFGVLVMQLVEGDPLADRIALGPIPWREAVRIGLRVAQVLAHAHARGVIHRDITPDNIIINGDRVIVLDFGIAARVGEPDEDSTGASFGTPAYVAPERLDGTPAQTATDIYALGVVLFEMLSMRVPFKVRDWDDVATERGPAPTLRIPGAPPSLPRLVARMLDRDSAKRPTAAQVVAALQHPARSRLGPVLAATTVVIGLAAVAAAWQWWPSSGLPPSSRPTAVPTSDPPTPSPTAIPASPAPPSRSPSAP